MGKAKKKRRFSKRVVWKGDRMSVKHLQNEIKRIVKEYELEDQVEIVIEEIKQWKSTQSNLLEQEHS